MEIWRLVAERVASLDELETTWSLDDVLRANAILDMRQAIEAELFKKLPKGKR